MAMGETKLKPCPFCGGAMRPRHALWPSEGDTDGIIHSELTDCPMDNFSIGTADEGVSVAAAWNRRPSHEARIAELEEALRLSLPALEWCQKQWADSPQSGEGVNVLDIVRAALAKAEAQP